MPDKAQTRSIGPDAGSATYILSFCPVLGGYYRNGILNNEVTIGRWWGSEAKSDASRYRLDYNGRTLYTGSSRYRHDGLYIRCVQAP